MSTWSQEESSQQVSFNTYTSSEGYLISNPYDAIYDNSGWLWILGENKFSNKYIFGEKEVIIQRFDGANFFTLKLPNTSGKKIKEGHFFRHKNKGLYLKLYYKIARAELFYIDTETLEMKAFDAYNNLDHKYIISEEYDVGGDTRLLITSKNKFYSAEIDQLQLQFKDSIALDKPVKDPFLSEIYTTDQYSIVKLLFEKEGLLLDANGKIKKKLSSNDFVNKKGKSFFPDTIQKFLKVNNEDYYYLDDYENAFRYLNGQFKEVPNTSDHHKLNQELTFNNDFSKAYVNQVVNNYSEFKLYRLKGLKPNLIAKIEIKNFSKTAFKKLGKDLVVLNGNTFTAYTFNNNKIKTFLKGKSIRTIKQLEKNTYIVATDNEGFYLIDTEANTERILYLFSNNKAIPVNYSRDLFIETNNNIITGDSNHIYTFNSDFELLKDQTINNVGGEMIKVKDNIFAQSAMGSISKFSINEKKSTKIPNTESIEIKEFASDGNILYATTNKGVFEYKNGTFRTYSFESINSENLLSITHTAAYGVLVSTMQGDIFVYDTTSKKLNLLYEDPLNASIVGMVTDDKNNLWLNTYAGIVSFNPTTNKLTRYTLLDGLYELEGNRYSTYKDRNGTIFMGSYRGLSVFDPNKLSTTKVVVQPKFTSISYFNSDKDRWEINTSPQFMENTQDIILPAEYRRFSVTVSVFEGANPQDLNYRYRLLDEESNSDWFTSYPGQELLYANLAPGKYKLQIEVLDTSNNKLGETLELTVISEQVFYKSWWFIVLFILIIASILIYLFNQYKVKQDLFAKNEIALNEANVKSDMMLEIHHRVKNNLQIVSALLGWQRANSNNEELKLKLEDSQNRIMSIAGIHDLLYQADNQNAVDVKEYVKNIIGYYKKLYSLKVNYQLKIDSTILNTDQATPLFLLLNELINNSNKHAFDSIDQPEITIYFNKQGENYEFQYFDNGNFKQKDETTKTMGMKIVEMMNKQLKGSLEITNAPNFNLTLLFPSHE